MATTSGVSNEYSRASKRFERSEFETKRKDWDKLLGRDLDTELPPELTGAQEGLDYQTPTVEKALFDHIDVLVMNPTIYDIATLDEGDEARKKGRDILLWTSRGWEYEDEGRWWDRAVGEGQVRHGVKAMALRWHPQMEPETGASEPGETIRERDKEFKRRRHPFYWKDIDIYGIKWLGDERGEYGADVLFYKYEIPYLEAEAQFSKLGKGKFNLTAGGKVWWGETQEEGAEPYNDDKVHVIVRDGRKLDGSRCPLDGCDHPQRSISIYVCPDGDNFTEEEKVEEIDSPFPGCSYFIIGGRMTSARDPHLRYRPLLLPLYVESAWQNYLNTILATISRTDYSDEYVYIDASKAPPHIALPEGGQVMSMNKADPTSGEIPILPGPLVRYPKTISPHLIEMIKQSAQRMETFSMNRFLAGNAYTEASNATASAFKAQYQQAALPFNALLSESDKAQLRSRKYEYHAIRYWGQFDPEGSKTKYYAVMSGQMKSRTHSANAGEVVWVDANKLDMDFDLRINTKSETLAEEEQRWFLAKDKFVSGAYTPDDLIRDAGFDDIEGQKQRLRAAYIQEDMDPLLRAAQTKMLIQKFSIATGFDLGALVGDPVFGPPSPNPALIAGQEEAAPPATPNPVVNGHNALNTPGTQVGPPQGVTGGASPVR